VGENSVLKKGEEKMVISHRLLRSLYPLSTQSFRNLTVFQQALRAIHPLADKFQILLKFTIVL
jgi:hypothetical protein